MERLPPQEIAARLGISPDNVYKRIQRGIERLRKQLDRRYRGREFWIAAFGPLVRRPLAPSAKLGVAAAAVLATVTTIVVLVSPARSSERRPETARAETLAPSAESFPAPPPATAKADRTAVALPLSDIEETEVFFDSLVRNADFELPPGAQSSVPKILNPTGISKPKQAIKPIPPGPNGDPKKSPR